MLPLRSLRFANVGQETRMGGAALGEVYAGLGQAEVSVDGEAHFRGVEILLAVVFPPADGAESERIRGFQRPVAAAWTAKLSLHA